MKQELFFGKLFPSHPLIMPILDDMREKYQIPEISPTDDGFRILLENELDIDWKAVREDILTRVKDIPDFLPEKLLKLYRDVKKFQSAPVQDPELEKVSQEFRDNFQKLVDAIVKMYEPTIRAIDKFYLDITKHCILFLTTGDALEVPQDWFGSVGVLTDSIGEKQVYALAGSISNPDELAEKFKEQFYKTFGRKQVKITENHIDTADYLRMKWTGKSMAYILEEDVLRNPKEVPDRASKRYTSAKRRQHSKLRQRIHRLEKTLNDILK